MKPYQLQIWETIRAHNQKHLRIAINNFNNRRTPIMNITQSAIIDRIRILQAQIQECERNHMALHGRLGEMKDLLTFVAQEEAKESQEACQEIIIDENIEVTPENIASPVGDVQSIGAEPCESNTN